MVTSAQRQISDCMQKKQNNFVVKYGNVKTIIEMQNG